ncbi:tetratricopeptide repeat protein [Heliophilum fasciatum]|uniref:Tfp pilus assembly protein PilF n=1 Tax=Heliophilum fasciatum TaxID=35700 RepID=A0A4R2S1Q1_9FIRM|nr:tetratricopeptide repeat protein [Heliophilum fasciatum]MCW2277454.1 tetratricopeptide (TPR) repeat protein [Heliophilum fasciatum]TCP65255.1 Tfp pilus assembly protein PilF [Heliophilum fasciatum]
MMHKPWALTGLLLLFLTPSAWAADSISPSGYVSFGISLNQQHRHTEAEAAYRQALALKPTYIEAIIGLSQTLMIENKFDEAALLLEQKMATTKDSRLFANLGEVKYLTGDYPKALSLYQTAVDLSHAASAYDGLGRSHIALHNLKEAEVAFRAGVAIDPNTVSNHINLINLLIDTDRGGDADASIRYAQRLGHHTAALYKAIGRLEWHRQHVDAAVAAFDEAARIDATDVTIPLLSGDLYAKQRNWPMAERYYRQALKIAPKQGDIAAKLAAALREQGHLAEAAAVLTNEPVANTLSTTFLLTQAAVLAQQQDSAGAESAYQKVLALNPSSVPAYLGLGQLYARVHRDGDAAKILTTAAQLAPQNTDVLFTLAEVQRRRQISWSALDLYQRVIAIDPTHVQARLGLAYLYVDLRRYSEAQALFESLRLEDASKFEPWLGLAHNYLRQGRYGEALPLYDRASTLTNHNALIYQGQSIILQAQGRTEEATTKLKLAQRYDPISTSPLAYNHLPKPVITFHPATGPAPLTAQVDGLASTDDDGKITALRWEWPQGAEIAPGTSSTATQATVTFPTPGEYTFKLYATDNHGAEVRTQKTITVSGTIAIVLDGKLWAIPPDQGQAQIRHNRVLVPLRAVFEAFGADVTWDSAAQTVTAVQGNRRISLTAGSMTARVNGEERQLDVPAIIDESTGRMLVPLRFVAESLGAKVDYQGATQTVLIDRP